MIIWLKIQIHWPKSQHIYNLWLKWKNIKSLCSSMFWHITHNENSKSIEQKSFFSENPPNTQYLWRIFSYSPHALCDDHHESTWYIDWVFHNCLETARNLNMDVYNLCIALCEVSHSVAGLIFIGSNCSFEHVFSLKLSFGLISRINS